MIKARKFLQEKKVIIILGLIVITLFALIVVGYIYLKNWKQVKPIDVTRIETSQKNKQKTELFEQFPSSSNIGEMVIDNDFIWVANGAGLIRYNKKSGEQKIFTESDGLLANETNSLIKYKDEVWVTSQSRGISILNTKNNSWRYFTTDNGLISVKNLIIKLDGDVIWLATDREFAKYDFKTEKWTNWLEGAGIKFVDINDFVFNNNFVWIYVSPNTYTLGEVLRLDKKALTWIDLQNNNQFFSSRYPLSDLYLDNDFFYVITSKKIYRQNIISDQWDSFENNETNLSKFNIGAIKHDNQYWAFNKDGNIEVSGGLNSSRQIINTDSLNQYCSTIKYYLDFSLIRDYERQFNFDGDILWFGCRQGFASYNLSNKTWNFKETISNYPAEIYNILAIKNGTLLVDSNLGLGLAIPDKQKWTFIKLLEIGDSLWGNAIWNGDDIYFTEIMEIVISDGPPPKRLWKYNILSKLTSQIKIPDNSFLWEIIDLKINDNLWLNFGDEIQEFNPISGEVFSYKPILEEGKRLEINNVKKNNDVLWFVSNLGLGSFNLISKKFEIIGNPISVKFPDQGLLADLFIVGNKIWIRAIGFHSDGVYVYDLTTKTWEHLTQTNSGLKLGWVQGLTGTTNYILITSLGTIDPSQKKRGKIIENVIIEGNHIYQQYGLNIYDVANNTWKFFTSEDGMLDSQITNMHVDGNDVWFVNNPWFLNNENGVWKLNLDRLK